MADGAEVLGDSAFERVVRNLPDAVMIATPHDASGSTIVYVNDAYSDLTGYRHADVIGRSTAMLTGPETDLAELARLRGLLLRGQRVCSEVVQHRADGTPFWAQREVVPVRDDDGAVRWLVAVLKDVSDRRRVEVDLGRSRDLRDLAAGAAGVGTWQWSPVTGVAAWDATTRSILGQSEREVATADAFLQVVHPDDHAQYLSALSGERPGDEVAFRIVRPDGTVRHVFARAVRYLGEDGALEDVAGVLVDVTDLRTAADLVADTLESISDAYYSLDEAWRITYLNARAEQFLGRPRSELLGATVWQEFPMIVGTNFEQYRQAMADRVEVTFEEHVDSHDRWYEVRAFPITSGIGVYSRDITARHRAAAEREELLRAERVARWEAERARAALAHQATHDALTGLVNRHELERAMQATLAHGPTPVTVLFIDLDRFKLVNDSLGHAVGDDLLRAAAHRISAAVRAEDVVARIGGDEFVVLLATGSRSVAEETAQRILESLRDPVTLCGKRLFVTASIGIAARTIGGTGGDLLADGDVALYRAKDAGKDRLAWCDDAARRDLDRRVRIEAELREALEQHRLVLHYQPAFDLSSGLATSVEALIRWEHPSRGLLGPSEFIAVAEESGLIEEIGDWVITRAVSDAGRWIDRDDGFTVWVNVSVRQLRKPGLAARVGLVLAAAGVPPHHLGLEVTESTLADDAAVTAEVAELSAMGVKIAIDDFGTGYSSLARLRHLPVDVLKIDQSFIADIETLPGAAVAQAIIQLAHGLGMTTIAEGIEEPSQLDVLRRLGCDAGAGFALARPAPAGATAARVPFTSDVAPAALRLVGGDTDLQDLSVAR